MRIPFRSLAVLALAGSAATCVDVATGPKPAAARHARILISPQFSASAARTAQNLADFGIQYDSARVVIVRPVLDTLIDTTLAFRPGQQDVTLDLTVPVHSDGEVFDAGMQFRDAAGVLFQGVTRVPSHSSSESAPNSTPIQVEYVGPGSSVVRLQINPRGGSFPTGSATTFSVTGFDAGGAVVPLVPVIWTGSDPTIADVSTSGVVHSTGKRGTVTVTARTPRDVADQVSVAFTPVAGSIALISGGGQTSAVNAPLGSPITIEVRATDNVGLPGVAVSFTAPPGGSATPATATTDASGRASTSVKLGNAAGPQSIGVNAAGFTLTVPATALPAGPASMAIASGDNQTDTVRKALRAPLVVKVLDAFTNPVAGATVTWAKSGGGSLSAGTTTSGADGQASVSYTLGSAVGDETITASVTGVAAAVTFTVHAVRSAPAAISVVSGTAQSASVNTTLPAQLVVKVVDAGNFAVSGASVSWSATNATIALSSTTDADGFARGSLKLGTAVGAASATASIGTLSVTFNVTAVPGPVSSAVFKRQPSAAIANAAINPSVDVQLFDAFGNATTSTASVTIALSGGTAGAVLSGTLARNAVGGVATFDDLRVDRTGTGYRLVATAVVTGNPQATSETFNVSPAAAANLETVSVVNQTALAGGLVEARPSVRVRDVSGNPVSGATVTFAPANAGSGSVTGGTQITDASGLATVGSWTVGTLVGTSTLVASVTGATSVSFTANVGAAAPTAVVFTTQPSNVVSMAPIAPFSVSIVDGFGNVTTNVAATPITVSIAAGPGAISGTATVSSVAGVATFTNVRIDRAAVGYRLTASAGGIPAQSAAFNVTTGAAATMAAVAGTTGLSAQAGSAVSAAPAVLVTDAGSNPVSGVAVTFTAGANSGTIVPPTPVSTGANGIASATSWTLGNIIGANSASAAANGLTTVQFTATATSGGVAGLSTTQGGASEPPTNVNNNTIFGSGPRIQLVDGSGNPVSLPGITVTTEIVNGSGFRGEEDAPLGGPSAESVMKGTSVTISPSSMVTNANGVADFSLSTIRGLVGTYAIRFHVTIGGQPYTVVSQNFDLRAGAVVSLTAAEPQPSVVLHGTGLIPRVIARDIDNNLVGGASILFAVSPGNGALGSPTTVITNASGIASSPNWSLPNTDRVNTLTACVAGNPCSAITPVVFTVETTHPSQLRVVQQPNQPTFGNGSTLNPLTVQLRDDSNRDIALAGAVITAAPGSATSTFNVAGTTTATTNASGLATFSGITIDAVAQPAVTIAFSSTFTMSGLPIASQSTNAFGIVAGAAQFVDAVTPGVFTATTGASFSPAPTVRVTDANRRNAVSTPVNMQWTLNGCPGTTATSPVPTSSGLSASSITAGTNAGSCTIQASAALTGSPVTFTLVIAPPGFVAFTGAQSSSWNTAGNWSNNSVPTATTDVFVASAVATKPQLSATSDVRSLTLESGSAQVNLGTNQLTVSGNLDASGAGIIGTGTLIQSPGAGATLTLRGSIPNLTVGADACVTTRTVALSAATNIIGNVTSNCRFNAGGFALTVGGSLTAASNGSFDMGSGSVVTINGNVAFNGLTSNLTGGTLELKGNLSEAGQVSTAFLGSGGFRVRFTADALQTVTFTAAHVGPSGSHFQHVDVVRAGGSSQVLFNSPVKVLGTLDVLTGSLLRVAAGTRLFIEDGAFIRLHAGSTLTLDAIIELEPGGACQRHNGSPPSVINGANPNGFQGGSCTFVDLP